MSESEKQIIKLLGDLLSKVSDQEILLEQVVRQQQVAIKGVDKTDHCVEQLKLAADKVMRGESPPSNRNLAKLCGLHWKQFQRWTAPSSSQQQVLTAYRNFESCKQAYASFANRSDVVGDDFIDDADRRIDLDELDY